MTELSDTHPYLYHYTTTQGLKGILESQTLWATHHQFLNDRSEGRGSIPIVARLLEPRILAASKKRLVDSGIDPKKLDEAMKSLTEAMKGIFAIAEGAYHSDATQFYVCSFCGTSDDEYSRKHGVLSQWRAYGHDGGYAIEFDAEKLEALLRKEIELHRYSKSEHLSEVVYEDDPKLEQIFSKELNLIPDGIVNYSSSPNLLSDEDTQKLHGAFAQLFSRIKHRAFKEEKEVRLAAFPFFKESKDRTVDSYGNGWISPQPEKQRLFFQRKDLDVPYIELFRNIQSRDLPITKIIVGPHHERDLRATSLRARLGAIEVAVSDIPYLNFR